MKLQVLNSEGKKAREIETTVFDGAVREDIIQRVVEAEKRKQPYAPSWLAGKQASASGVVKHGRRKWKTAYGKGISRVPRKIFWRRGTQFYWQAATIASARKGRRAHPPKILAMLTFPKINKKEKRKAFSSALALTASLPEVIKKYQSLKNKKIEMKLPLVVESKILEQKTKDFFRTLKTILNGFYEIALQEKNVRAGRGKTRGRKYKKRAGLLLVAGNNENKKISGIEIKQVSNLLVSDLASNGARIVVYTEQAIKDLEKRIAGKKTEEAKIKTERKEMK